MASLEQLIQKSREGDQEAFCEIVDLFKAYVFAIILHYTRDHEEAENIAQEVFLQIYRSLPQYRCQNFKAWVGRIAVTKAIDQYRTNLRFKREKAFPTEEILSLASCNTRDDPETIFLQGEQKRRIEEICATLPKVYSRTIRKYYLEEKSYQEIAAEEGISIKSVESRLYRGRKLFRQKWGRVEK
ncbi:MAG: RNA polymerase sigma factor [Peptococcia bacterium]|jgi:RNA polymerase sigma factor (sigma-70 family)